MGERPNHCAVSRPGCRGCRPAFRSLVVWQEVVERCGPVAAGWRVRCGSATAGTCCSPTSRTSGCSVGVRSPAMSRYFVSRRTTARQHQSPAWATRDLRAPDPTRHSDEHDGTIMVLMRATRKAVTAPTTSPCTSDGWSFHRSGWRSKQLRGRQGGQELPRYVFRVDGRAQDYQ